MDAVPKSRREQKKAEVRDALVQAADTLFVEQGYEGTTVDQIAERAGVSRRTFFRYFPSKEAIAFPRAEERRDAFRALLLERFAEQEALPAVRAACLEVGKMMVSTSAEELRRQNVIDASPTLLAADLEIYRAWEHVIADAVTRGGGEEGVRIGQLFAAATIGIVRSVLRAWFDANCESDVIKMAEEAFGLLETGFGGRL
ncbi:MAG: TetR family transcriptional regulator [Nannocystaceae bacterium]|nr:TetR family transcriptional regulator [Nannocystaceae bacterium]